MRAQESLPERDDSFALQPHLVGEWVEVRPLQPKDWQELFAVASDPLIWEQHPAYDRYKEEVFREFFQGALDSRGAFAVMDHNTQEIIGSSRYCDLDVERGEVEIGWTFLARSHWGGKYNGELKQLMLDHAFRFVKSVIFVVGENNVRSRKAVEKIGGVLRDERRTSTHSGRTVTSVVYEIQRS
jgi:RimJ/RimL family protein N-acetyltransferase